MIEFISRRHANDDFEVIVRTNNEEYYKAVIDLARQLIDHSNNGTTVHFKPVVPGSTDCYTISEMSYNNGYAKGLEDGKPKWIPVSERLPEIDDDVLMYFAGDKNMTAGFLADVDEDETLWSAYSDGGFYTDCDYTPTHWMPLPEPPKEVKHG